MIVTGCCQKYGTRYLSFNIGTRGHIRVTFSQLQKELAEKTKFTPDEIEHWYHGFIQDCPTGKLTKVEFANIYAQFFPQGDPTAFAS